MDGLLPRSVMDTIRRTAKSLKGHARRVFQAIVTNEHAEGKPRKAETLFGWNRDAVKRGLFEQHMGREIRTKRLPSNCKSIRWICLQLEQIGECSIEMDTHYGRFEKPFQSRRFLKPMQSFPMFRQLTYEPRTTPPFCESLSTPKPR